MTAIDFIVLLPVIPALPILVTWYLPWEKWIPWAKLPFHFLGPYILYVAFVAWHFELPWWVSLIWVIFGAIITLIGVAALLNARKLGDHYVP